MGSKVFIDTSGFYALLLSDDDRHRTAAEHLKRLTARKTLFVTTEHVLDETATLLRARKHGHLLAEFFRRVFASQVFQVEWTDPDRFRRAMAFFLKHHDQSWSFTDCLSFCVMQELGIRRALTKDGDFRQAGFDALLQS
jgi:predicted nucleic acid-binding protein